MLIWIRSQDKRMLVNVIQVFVMSTGAVKGMYAAANEAIETLGNYDTEERALQVLDMIIDAISAYDNDKVFNLSPANVDSSNRFLYPVFDMPAK